MAENKTAFADSSGESRQKNQMIRPPIVVILGHVDHGKTTILDAIRKTKVAEKEAGGITQHVGAYQAECRGKKITFLDTPGHEAFSAIRSRGAKVADVAVLVVAADEGVKPQTKEAIEIIKEAKIPVVVTINKIDKEGANPAQARQQLAEQEVFVEDYGGKVPVVEISARNGEGIDRLLEMILLVAEMEELPLKLGMPAEGYVIESHLDNRRGVVATLIILQGELNVSDWIVAGNAIARAKLIEDFTGKAIKSTNPSQPCVVLGWESAPDIGQKFLVVASRDEAAKILESQKGNGHTALFIEDAQPTGKKIANLVVKSDVQSSLEAIDKSLRTIKSEEVAYKVVDYGVGKITDNDIRNARSMGAAIIGFHVPVEKSTLQLAEREKVKIQTFDIIYELIEAVRDVMSDLLEPEIKREDIGKMKVLATFGGTPKSQIVGGKIIQGKIARGAQVSAIRNGQLLVQGKVGQLQTGKQDVAEAAEGLEAGIRFDIQNGADTPLVKEGDLLEIFIEEKIKRKV
ncbi:MAG: translation initiation factor IF-2 [Parcubacteria group bacterium Licking1014_17]|nr:MAG: translation initiation factor IF-2 [Parcubacteria group bacterium Licking1014_17]